MRIGILGCGYVGIALAIRLGEKNHQLHLTTTTPEKVDTLMNYADQVHLVKVSQSSRLQTFLDHLDALFITVAPLPGATYKDTYTATAKALANALETHGKQIRFIGYTSTTSVYGQHEGEWIDESSPLNAVSPNSESLVESEQIYQSLETPDRLVCILRLGEIYGPGRELEQRIKPMSGSTLPGRGSSYVNLIHLEDIVGAFIFCLEHQISGIFNLCNHSHMTRKDLYSTICAAHGWPAPSWDLTESVASFKQNKRVSSEKIESLGYRFLFPEALEKLQKEEKRESEENEQED